MMQNAPFSPTFRRPWLWGRVDTAILPRDAIFERVTHHNKHSNQDLSLNRSVSFADELKNALPT